MKMAVAVPCETHVPHQLACENLKPDKLKKGC